MRIETGLFDQMVVQRTRQDISDARFSGSCEAIGPVLATVYRGRRRISDLTEVKVGKAVGGRFEGRLEGIPVGGPYEIRLTIGAEKLTVRDVLVGDVWLLGGQSNMQGCGTFPDTPLPGDRWVRAFYMDDRWAPAAECIHNLWDAIDPVHVDLRGGERHPVPVDWGVGPGSTFGIEMRRLTGIPQGLIACAHGATTMSHWDPALKNQNGKSLYGAMMRRFVKNGSRVAGLVWYQGCSDANAQAAAVFTERMVAFVKALRRDTGDKALPVVTVQIARVIGWGDEVAWSSIQDQQRCMPQVIRHLETVPAIDLSLDDTIHLSGEAQIILGRRLAGAMQALRVGEQAGMPPIELHTVKIVQGKKGMLDVMIAFKNVEGGLRSGDRPSGFSIQGGGVVFDVRLEGACVRVRTSCADLVALQKASVHYGRGTHPYCNITDEGGRALPVFGPLAIGP